jgi:hypothetical protein
MRFLIAISIYACAAFAQPALPTAASRAVNLPVVGLASSETAQVNVASPGFSGIADAPLPTPCTGTIAFTNASGAAIGSPTSFSITLAQVSSATVPYSAVVPGDTSSDRQRQDDHSGNCDYQRGLPGNREHGNLRHRNRRNACPR